MSDLPTIPTLERTSWFRPVPFVLGFAAALAACSIVARVASHEGYHTTFTRFHNVISPAGQYYPTIDEMCGIVRSRCQPDQILVIVGGNSVFQGVGQPASRMWTVELQRLLGPRYKVLNLAFAGSLCTDGGARVAEALRQEFPRQVYVANTTPFSLPYPEGIEPYRYLLWQARGEGLLERYPPRDAVIDQFIHEYYRGGARFELEGKGWLDRFLRYNDLWNWFGYEYFFTIKNPLTPTMPMAVWARKRFEDHEPDYELSSVAQRFPASNDAAEMPIVRAFSGHFYEKDASGAWRPIPSLRKEFMDMAKAAFPDDLKRRTLIMLSRNSAVYLRMLTPDELKREDAAYRDGVQAWREAGYASAEYGRDFVPADFGDRTHLASSGGRKLAAIVADQVRAMAASLGYEKEGSR